MRNDLQGTRVLDSNRGYLVQRHVATPGRDLDAVQDARVGTTGADGSQVATQRLDGLTHAILGIFLDSVDHF
ncbi:hypothetical protein D3C81_1657070 [compost metagenome]